jgi:hypothetical protein
MADREIEARDKRLLATEKLYQKAKTEETGALLDSWVLDQLQGSYVNVYPPELTDLVQRAIWRGFRDAIFFAKYYEGNDSGDKLEKMFLDVLANKDIFNEDEYSGGTDWRPDIVKNAVNMLKTYRSNDSTRFTGRWLERYDFSILPDDLLRYGERNNNGDIVLRAYPNLHISPVFRLQ